MSSFSSSPAFEKKVHKSKNGLVVGIINSHGLA